HILFYMYSPLTAFYTLSLHDALPISLENAHDYKTFLHTVSHEFFHTWNVKQFRPAGIHPYDYSRENYTELLWVVEGTTSYYADRSEEHTSELQSRFDLVCRLLPEKKKLRRDAVQPDIEAERKKRDEIEAGKSYCSRRFGGATCDDKSAQIYARSDKNDWRIQPAEFYRFHDAEVNTFGYF